MYNLRRLGCLKMCDQAMPEWSASEEFASATRVHSARMWRFQQQGQMQQQWRQQQKKGQQSQKPVSAAAAAAAAAAATMQAAAANVTSSRTPEAILRMFRIIQARARCSIGCCCRRRCYGDIAPTLQSSHATARTCKVVSKLWSARRVSGKTCRKPTELVKMMKCR